MELKIPQLTLAKIAQMGRHENVNTRSEHYSSRIKGSIPVRGNFFAEFIYSGRSDRMIYLWKTSMECISDLINFSKFSEFDKHDIQTP